jgi:hypothetical protein
MVSFNRNSLNLNAKQHAKQLDEGFRPGFWLVNIGKTAQQKSKNLASVAGMDEVKI